MQLTDILQDPAKSSRTLIEPSSSIVGAPEAFPVWVRLPRPNEREKYTNLPRSTLNALILGPHPKVKSVVLKKKYASRGTRLVLLKSLLDFLNGLMDDQHALDGTGPNREHPEIVKTEFADSHSN